MLRYGLTSGANLSRRLALAPASFTSIPRAGRAQVAFKSSKALENEESLNSSSGSKNNSGKQQESKKDLPSFLGTIGEPSSSNSSSGGGTDALKAFFEKRRATLEKEKEKALLEKSEQPQPPNQRQQPQSTYAGRGQGNGPARSNKTAGSPSDFTALRNALSRKPQPKQQQQQQQPGSQQRQSQSQSQQGLQQRPQQSQINRNNNPNPQQQQRSSRPLPNTNNNNNNNGGRPNQQSFARNNGGNENNRQEIPRLADLMKHLRPDVLTQQPREQNNNRRDSIQRQEQPQWRQRRQQQQQQQQQQQRPGQDSMEQRQFQQRPSSFSQRGPRQPFQRQKNDDFLQGRIARADEDDATSTPASHASKKEDDTRTITLPLDDMTLTEMSILYRIKVDDIKRKLKSMGERVNDKYMLDVDMAELLAMEYGLETVRSIPRTVMDAEQILLQRRAGAEEVEESSSSSSTTEVEKPSFDSFPPRPPVVCIMGHVDHGKTTLMDALRRRSLQQQGGGDGKEKKQKGGATAAKSKDVAGTEAGGITQIISAFQVTLEGQDSAITFLDTPGHAAFSAMRQSGSHAADVIVLVVAADDGVSEQTVEIINFYKSIVQGAGDSGISMIIALNKIDKPGLDVDQAKMRIENQLLEHGIITEGLNYSGSEYGLPVTVVPTSGMTGQGLDELMESLFLQSEIMDLRADDKACAEGIVLDARLEKGLGVVVDCIVRWGSIKKGDVVVSGTQLGKVRMLKDGE
jgi:translation initiation factor IF-2